MAIKTVHIGGFGPFEYDDEDEKAIETDGEVDAADVNILNALQKNPVDISLITYNLDVEDLIVTLDFA